MYECRIERSGKRKEWYVQEYGIPAHYGLLSSLGAAMMMVALLSAAYHICPNRLNFQFGNLHSNYLSKILRLFL